MKNNILSTNQLTKKYLSKKENINYLVRILARFGNIPKTDGIEIILSKQEPKLFKIVPGESIIIGSKYLNNPVLALIYLRYGVEWQIWFKAFNQNKNSTLLFDCAAFKVTLMFFDLLPKQDKIQLERGSSVLTDLIKEKKTFLKDIFSPNFSLPEQLTLFHDFKSTKKKLKPSWKPIIQCLAKPTELLLMSGGDFRLNIDEKHLLNKYGCRPFPRPEAFTFASSTATSVSNYAFGKTEIARAQLITNGLTKGIDSATSDFSKSLKLSLKSILNFDRNVQTIFSPSGTDSALQIAAITQIVSKKEITHILVGSDETGSGVPNALKGRHFENNTALNFPVKKGEEIDGFRPIELVKIPFRDDKGRLKTSLKLDNEVLSAYKNAFELGRFVVLHIMDQSKLGYQAPTKKLLKEIDEIYNKSGLVVVDASQFRLDSEDINNYLDKGYIVTITGSKFFTGPPYSGALVIPESISSIIEEKGEYLPIGLSNYYNDSDWPENWSCSNILPNGFNYGTYFRWNSAISEMKRYFNTPLLYRNLAIEMFCDYIQESIKESTFLEQLNEDEFQITSKNNLEVGLNSIRTIYPFFVKRKNTILDEESVKKLYLLLNADISKYFRNATIETLKISSQKCHIGQSVKVLYKSNIKSAVLRISLGARVISEGWRDKDVSTFFSRLEEQMNQITIIIKKIDLIVNHSKLLDE